MNNTHFYSLFSTVYSTTALEEQLRYQRRLKRLQDAVAHYQNQGVDRHRILQDALRDVNVPSGINMTSVSDWITQELQTVESTIAETLRVQEHLMMLRDQDRIVREAQKRATSIRRQLKKMVGKTVFA